MVLLARPIRYVVSGLPTPSSAAAGRRPLTPLVPLLEYGFYEQLLDKLTGALLVLPQQWALDSHGENISGRGQG